MSPDLFVVITFKNIHVNIIGLPSSKIDCKETGNYFKKDTKSNGKIVHVTSVVINTLPPVALDFCLLFGRSDGLFQIGKVGLRFFWYFSGVVTCTSHEQNVILYSHHYLKGNISTIVADERLSVLCTR